MTFGFGALAQLGERLLCKHQVIGSIPIGSTNFASEHHAAHDDPRNSQAVEDGAGSGCGTAALIKIFPGMKTSVCRTVTIVRRYGGICPLFDIVNGFLKSMPWQYRSFSQESVPYCY